VPVVAGCSDDVSSESRSRDPRTLSSAHTTPGIPAVAGQGADERACRRGMVAALR
jgi:hypothetical protein